MTSFEKTSSNIETYSQVDPAFVQEVGRTGLMMTPASEIEGAPDISLTQSEDANSFDSYVSGVDGHTGSPYDSLDHLFRIPGADAQDKIDNSLDSI